MNNVKTILDAIGIINDVMAKFTFVAISIITYAPIE